MTENAISRGKTLDQVLIIISLNRRSPLGAQFFVFRWSGAHEEVSSVHAFCPSPCISPLLWPADDNGISDFDSLAAMQAGTYPHSIPHAAAPSPFCKHHKFARGPWTMLPVEGLAAAAVRAAGRR
jgi:hypothetical protein